MIHYHGTPVGGKREDAAKFLAGRHALVPFPRKDDLGVVADVCKSFFSITARSRFGKKVAR